MTGLVAVADSVGPDAAVGGEAHGAGCLSVDTAADAGSAGHEPLPVAWGCENLDSGLKAVVFALSSSRRGGATSVGVIEGKGVKS